MFHHTTAAVEKARWWVLDRDLGTASRESLLSTVLVLRSDLLQVLCPSSVARAVPVTCATRSEQQHSCDASNYFTVIRPHPFAVHVVVVAVVAAAVAAAVNVDIVTGGEHR